MRFDFNPKEVLRVGDAGEERGQDHSDHEQSRDRCVREARCEHGASKACAIAKCRSRISDERSTCSRAKCTESQTEVVVHCRIGARHKIDPTRQVK